MLEVTLRLAFSFATFGAMASWEHALPRRELSEPRRRRWPANLGLGLLNAILLRVLAGGLVVSAAAFAATRGTGLVHWTAPPVWAGWMVTIAGLDFAVYLQHILFHAVPVLWRVHRVHHADTGFDTTTGVRFHPIEMLVSAGLKAAVVVLLGGLAWAVVAFEILLNASSLFNHGNVFIPPSVDRWLRFLIVTPDMHRIHHCSQVAETNSNFGFSLSLWDRLCGTYLPEPARGQLGLEIGLSEYRRFLNLRELLRLPFHRPAAPHTFGGNHSATARMIEPHDLQELLSQPDPPTVLDVRRPDELAGPLGRLESAVNIPIEDLPTRLDELATFRPHLLVPV